MYRKLHERRLRIGRSRVERLMRLHSIHAHHKRGFKVTAVQARST